jgi:hypothetical protein
MPNKIYLSRLEYRSYIQSNEWMLVKKRYLNSKLPKDCYCCGKKYGTYKIEFHHRTYKRLGCERLLDIVPVCRECHQGIHDMKSMKLISLWSATKKIKRKTSKKLTQAHPSTPANSLKLISIGETKLRQQYRVPVSVS